jgi:MscS family membrane protein
VGGIAFALAAQDTLKNLIGSVIILLDRPYTVGQRVIVAGHDGEVEEIGLRSTKLRLLTGNQSIIPNEVMAKSAIENVSRRPHIRHKSNIALPYDTPLLKVKKAVEIIRTLLGDHEGMDTKKPAQVYFSSFKRDHLSIVMCYWYHPADYWTYMAFSQKVNEQIMERFEEEGISFALPTNRTFLEQ